MKLNFDFYNRSALVVAKALLGQVLVHETEAGRRAGRIVETEAYVGAHDLACHASKGRTARTDVMFGPAGHAYVFLVYGMHHCFNVVVDAEGVGAAVLVRGVEPLEGIAPDTRTDGPGRVCQRMGITLAHNRLSLLEPGPLFIEPAPSPRPRDVARGPRIGVDYAGEWAAKPYRWWVRESPGVSRVAQRAPGSRRR